jgi:hypothetical protein
MNTHSTFAECNSTHHTTITRWLLHTTPFCASALSRSLDRAAKKPSDQIIVSTTDYSNDRQSCSLDEIATAESSGKHKLSLRNEPLLRDDVPIAEITTHELELHLRPLTSGELDLLEAAKLLRGCTLRGAIREVQVQLRDGRATHVTSIADGRLSGVEDFLEGGVAARLGLELCGTRGDLNVFVGGLDGEGGKLESGVREPETKFIANVDVLCVEVTVVNLKLLVKVRLPIVLPGSVNVCDNGSIVIRSLVGDRVRQVAGRVHIAIKNIDDGIA